MGYTTRCSMICDELICGGQKVAMALRLLPLTFVVESFLFIYLFIVVFVVCGGWILSYVSFVCELVWFVSMCCCLLACLSSFRRVHLSGAALWLIFFSFELGEEFVNCDIGYIC